MGELSVCLNISVCWWTATQTRRHCTVCLKATKRTLNYHKKKQHYLYNVIELQNLLLLLLQGRRLQSADNRDKLFSSEVVKRLCKQCMNGQETAHTVCSSITEDFNCLNLFVVKLFIKRLQTTSVTQMFNFLSFFKVYFILMT